MVRRPLTQVEADAYVKAGLTVAQPGHVEQQLRRHAERFESSPAALKALADVLILEGKPRAALAVHEGLPAGENAQRRTAAGSSV